MLRARLQNPEAKTDSLIEAMTDQFVEPSRADVRAMLEELSMAMQVYPWEGSWMFRLTSQASIDHGWSAAYVHGQMADTPSWNSTRRGMFMVTDDHQAHPDLLEDIQLRCEQAYDHLSAALERCRKAAPLQPEAAEQRSYLHRLAGDIDGFARVARSFALHLRETNVAMLLRQDLEAKRPMDKRLLEELGRLLEADAENQHRQGRVMDKKTLFAKDPEQFLRTELLPTDKTILEKGHFTVTTR
jgi:hypothetical protein